MTTKAKIIMSGFNSGALFIFALMRFEEGGPDAYRGVISLFFCVFFLLIGLSIRTNSGGKNGGI